MSGSEDDAGEKTSRFALTLRMDLIIAVCALLISTLATAASWWQTRATYEQTHIIEEQLSAQVWPYVGIGEGLAKGDTVSFTIENDGLGPAVVRRVAMFVDGRERSNFVDVLHAVLGPNIQRRRPPGQGIGLNLDYGGPGFVIRPGDSRAMLSFRSKAFAPTLMRALGRIEIRTCYCSIVPGRCWHTTSSTSSDPQPVLQCDEDQRDLLHANSLSELLRPF
jgi:hypothetical protein